MAEIKSYMVDIRLELVTEDDEEVKAVRIHGMKHDPLPLSLTCDFIYRIQMMTPGEPVMFTPSAKPREPLVENGKMYVLKYSDCQFQSGDYFEAFGDRFLQHVRSGEVVEVTEGNVAGFVCCGDSQAFTKVPASPEEVGFTDRIIKQIKKIKDGDNRRDTEQFSMLHEMLTNYCKKHEEKFKDKPCRVIWTPDNGITLTIFKTSVVVGCKAKVTIYGHIKYSDGRLPRYIDLAGARYLIKKLSDKL